MEHQPGEGNPGVNELESTFKPVIQAQWAERHPFWFVAILEGVVILVYLGAGTIGKTDLLPF